MEEQKRTRKCSIQRAHYSLNRHASMRLQRPVEVNMYRGGGLLTNSPFGLPHTRQRHDTFSSRWPAAEKRRRGKKENLETTTGSLRGRVDKACVGGRLRMCRYPVCFGVHLCVKFQYLGGKITIAQRPSNDLEDRCEGIFCVTVRVNSLVIRLAFKKIKS